MPPRRLHQAMLPRFGQPPLRCPLALKSASLPLPAVHEPTIVRRPDCSPTKFACCCRCLASILKALVRQGGHSPLLGPQAVDNIP